MVRRPCILVAVVGLSAGTASAQAVDARAVLQAAVKAMGGENLKTIEYSGAGWSSMIGQTYGLAEAGLAGKVDTFVHFLAVQARLAAGNWHRAR